jgi:hypothetical protein
MATTFVFFTILEIGHVITFLRSHQIQFDMYHHSHIVFCYYFILADDISFLGHTVDLESCVPDMLDILPIFF